MFGILGKIGQATASMVKKGVKFATSDGKSQKVSEKKKNSFLSKHKGKLIIGGAIAVPLLGLLILVMGISPAKPAEPPLVCNTEQNSTAPSGGDGTGEWTQDGTGANKVAKTVWDYWNKKGYSAAAIAGVMGNVYAESGFNPTVAQGGGSMLKDTPEGGGGGLYQFTPYSKFAAIGDKKLEDVGAQNEFVWSSEANGFKGYATITSIGDATQEWFTRYERGAVATAHMEKRTAAAEQAYKMWGSSASKTGSESVIDQSNSNASTNSSNSSASAANQCQTNQSADGNIAKVFDDKLQGLLLNAGLDDPNHMGIGTGSGVHGPGSHDGWDMDPIGDGAGVTSPAIYAITGGKIEGVGRGDNGGLLFVNVKMQNGNFVQYQEFKQGSIPGDIQKGKEIKSGTKVGEIGDAGSTGGIHSGRYVHITYSGKDTPVNAQGGIESWGATKNTLSLGELLGISADRWVHAPQSYKWSDMKSLSK